jgi:DNA-binding protein YbaB
MDPARQEALRSTNTGLSNQLGRLLDAAEREQARLAEAYQGLETFRLQSVSPDKSVEVTVDAGGVLTDLSLTAYALRKSPEELARTIVEAVQAAAHHAKEHGETVAAPEETDRYDLPDFMQEAPALADIRSYLRGDRGPAA